MALKQQLRGILKQVVVLPRFVDSAGVAHALPIQLASKVTPEMEARDEEMISALDRELSERGVMDTGTKYEQVRWIRGILSRCARRCSFTLVLLYLYNTC